MRAWELASILLLLTTPLTGCLASQDNTPTQPAGATSPLSANLSTPRFETANPEAVWIPASSDDTELFAKLWRPDTANSSTLDWNAPLILVMTPYQGYDGREDPLDATSRPSSEDYTWLIDYFVPRGYAVAFLDVRGTGESGGCLEQTAEKQRQDGYDAVEWFADQDWSNGHVGMYGRSYRAETQIGTAILNPPHLSTIIPVASVAGQYEWNYFDGVPFTLHTLTGNAAYLATEGAHPSTEPRGIAQYPSKWTCQPDILTQDADHSGDWSPYWQARELRDYVDQINHTSILYVHGLQDWNVRPVALQDMWTHISTEKRLILGQWSHAFPDNGYGDEPKRDDWRTLVHAWFDHELLTTDNNIHDILPPVQIQDANHTWRSAPAWPTPHASPHTLHLTASNTLSRTDPGAIEPALTFRENDEGFLSNATGVPAPTVPTEGVPTQLTFTTQPLNESLHITGTPRLSFDLSLFDGFYPDPDTTIDAHIAANLYWIDESGTKTWINSGYTSARHRLGLDNPQPVQEDTRLDYTLRFHPQDTPIPKGAQLHLVLSGSDRWTEAQGSFFGADLHDGTLTLPTVPGPTNANRLQMPLLSNVTTSANQASP